MTDKKDEYTYTTDEDFEVFKEECNKWIKRFGLFGWKVYYHHEEIDENAYAVCFANTMGRVSDIKLNKKCDTKDLNIRKTAFHEVCELLLAKVEVLIKDRAYCYEDTREEIHNLIRIFERVIYDSK